MSSTPLFATGRHEISPAAAEAARTSGIDPQTLFARHEHGDWGDAPEWLRRDNANATALDSSFHAIRSHYKIGEQVEFVVVSARGRDRTRLQLASEYTSREVSVQEGYAAWAETYHYYNPLIAVEEPAVESLLGTFPLPASAIDIGTGTGRLARLLARRGVPEVLGLDATPEMLAVARATAQEEGLTGLRFALASLGEAPLPIAADTFEMLTCGLMLTHVPNLRDAIRECVRVVKPGGRLLLTDFHPATAVFGWRTDFVTPDCVYLMPNGPNTREDYLEGLTDAGCDLLEVQDIALDGRPYGDLSEAAMRANGLPPLCLVILAQKRLPA